MQYHRTPRAEDYSPSELLNGHQIRSRNDILLPSPAHHAMLYVSVVAQGMTIPDGCLHAAVVTKMFGTQRVNVHKGFSMHGVTLGKDTYRAAASMLWS